MLSELFAKFAHLYPELVQHPFRTNEDTDILRHEIPSILKKIATIPDSYKIYGSVGQGQWSEIPWVAILDKDVTTSTQKGYYIVFLFSADMKQVFLSLSLGWEQFEQAYGIHEGRIAIEQTVQKLQKILRSPLDDFSFSKRNLKATKTLGKGYESGGICHKVYNIENFPTDEDVIHDLQNLMGVYRELKGHVGKDILNIDISEEEVLNEEFQKIVIQESEQVNTADQAKQKIAELTKIVESAPAAEKTKLARYIARNRKFAQLTKEAASYICQICGMPPFKTKAGGYYAEAHHQLELAKHKIDHPDIMVCICAQCHRVITYGTEEELEKRKNMKSSTL